MSDAPPPGWGGPPPPPPPSGQGPYPAGFGQQPPAPPPGYQAYSPMGGMTAKHPQGTTVLVLGILSFFCFGIVLGPIAWILGQKAMSQIESDPTTTYTNRSQVNAGRICGIIGTCLSILQIVIVIATR